MKVQELLPIAPAVLAAGMAFAPEARADQADFLQGQVTDGINCVVNAKGLACVDAQGVQLKLEGTSIPAERREALMRNTSALLNQFLQTRAGTENPTATLEQSDEGEGEKATYEQAREILGEHFYGLEEIQAVLGVDGYEIVDQAIEINATVEQLQKWVSWAKEHTRGEKMPILLFNIKQVRDREGNVHDFSPEFIAEWLKTTTHPNLKGKEAIFSKYVKGSTQRSAGNGKWSYLFSDGVSGSGSKNEAEQVAHSEATLGSDQMADAPDLFKAMVLHHARTGEWLFDDIWVRTETKDTVGGRVVAHSWRHDGEFELDGTDPRDAGDDWLSSHDSSVPEFSQ